MTVDSVTSTAPRQGFRIDFHIWGPVVALLALVALGAFLNPNFLSYGNVTNVLARSAFIGIIAVGMTFVITAGGLDLSVGSMAAFIAGAMILIMNALVPSMGVGWGVILVGMLAALVVGLAAGLVNGLLITQARIEAFIVTLGTMGIFRSLITWLADGGTLSLDYAVREIYRPVYYDGLLGVSWPIIVFAAVAVVGEIIMRMTPFARHCAALGSHEQGALSSAVREIYRPVYYDGLLGVSWPIIVFAAVAVVGEIIMRMTPFGRHCAAIGSNEQVALYSAVHVNRVRLMTYVLLGMLVGIATIM